MIQVESGGQSPWPFGHAVRLHCNFPATHITPPEAVELQVQFSFPAHAAKLPTPPGHDPPVAPPGHVGGGTAVAIQAPFWQDPTLHGVPNALGLILPALQLFLPCFRSHLPFLQVSHSLGLRLHCRDSAVASFGSASPRTPTAPLMTAVRARRRVPRAVRERARVSKREASMTFPTGIACERRWRPGARAAHSRQRRLGCCWVQSTPREVWSHSISVWPGTD